MAVNLPTELLRSFAAIVDSGSMLRATERVFVTQSALSLQMKRLEETVQASLFQREGRRLALTPAGDGRLVLTADPSRCLLLYPLAAWEPIQTRLMALSSFNEQIRGLQRMLVGHADDVEIDAAGRILVPPALRRYAGLDKHVVLVGQGQKFELWDEAQWQVETAQAIAFPANGLPPELDGFSL
jgi:MraZ protein